MDGGLPSVVDAETPLAPRELALLREQHQLLHGTASAAQATFNYAWGLVRSRDPADLRRGIDLLRELYRSNAPRRRECLYYIAVAEYKLGNNAGAREHIRTLLVAEPNNTQALALSKLIDDRVRSDGVVGIALASAAVAAVGLLSAALFRRR